VSPPSSSDGRRAFPILLTLSGVTAAAAALRWWYTSYVLRVPAGFTAVVYSASRRIIHRVITGPEESSTAAAGFCCLPFMDPDATAVIVPTAMLIDQKRAGPVRGCTVTVVVNDVQLDGHAPLRGALRVDFAVRVAELNRYVSLHDTSTPHARIGETVSETVCRVVKDLGDVDPEALLSASRRERCFDGKATAAIRDALWQNCGVRCLQVKFDGFTEGAR
jgi:hypothetical protein